jgi:hypothetical protein
MLGCLEGNMNRNSTFANETHNGVRDHVLRAPITKVVSEMVDNGASVDELTEALLLKLSELSVISYAANDKIKLLTPAARVLVSLMERPDLTMRELSLYLGITEAGVMKYIVTLAKANVITRTKVNGRNSYRFNVNEGLSNPDIIRFYTAIQKLASQISVISPDSAV